MIICVLKFAKPISVDVPRDANQVSLHLAHDDDLVLILDDVDNFGVNFGANFWLREQTGVSDGVLHVRRCVHNPTSTIIQNLKLACEFSEHSLMHLVKLLELLF